MANDETIKSLEEAISNCTGNEKCFLDEFSAVKCPYMGEEMSEWATDKNSNFYLNSYYKCGKYENGRK